jgi:hypothetical protein
MSEIEEAVQSTRNKLVYALASLSNCHVAHLSSSLLISVRG